jgi:glutathione reductase (NADPH)
MHAFDALAIDVRTGTTVEAIEKVKSSFIVHARSYGRQATFVTDFVVRGARRAPALEELDLTAADVEVEMPRLN